MTLFADAALAFAALCSFVLVGVAALAWLRAPFAGLERLAFGAGAGVLIHALAGFAVALSPAKQVTAWTLFAILWTGAAWTFRRMRLNPFLGDTVIRPSLAVLAAFVLGCVGATHLPVRFPAALPDGRYVFKQHALPVKMQILAGGFPVDNYLPYAVGEFLLRDISFAREHPILPNEEVSNRPVLMALAVVPFRAALDPPGRQEGPLPRFHYAGADWPDVGSFMAGDGFREFLDVGIALNALLLLGAALVFAAHGPRALFVGGLLALATSPFYVSQTIFTWPKGLATFYLLLALHALARRKNAGWVAAAGALAYWAHPLALVFLAGFGAHYVLAAWRERDASALARYGLIAALGLAPWFAWTGLFLRLPSNLLAQNMAGPHADSLAAQVWVRIGNVLVAFVPWDFRVRPCDVPTLFRQMLGCLPGVLGLCALPAYAGLAAGGRDLRVFAVQGVVLPAVLLALPFGRSARLTWLGYHPVGVCLFLLALGVLARAPRRVAWGILAAQIAGQVALLAAFGRAVTAAG